MLDNQFVNDLQHALRGRSVLDYYRDPLPGELDNVLETAVHHFIGGSDAERLSFNQTLVHAERSLFGIYSHRATALALREQSVDRLRCGLVASVIANFVPLPGRRPEAIWVVYHHCGRKLEQDILALFAEAAGYAPAELAGKMVAFGRRGDISLRLAGWREVKTPEGVWFKFG